MALSIVRGSIDDVDSLEPLWVAVHHAHAASMPELAPYVSDAETWAEHRPLYVELFEKPDTTLLLAHVDGELAAPWAGWLRPARLRRACNAADRCTCTLVGFMAL